MQNIHLPSSILNWSHNFVFSLSRGSIDFLWQDCRWKVRPNHFQARTSSSYERESVQLDSDSKNQFVTRIAVQSQVKWPWFDSWQVCSGMLCHIKTWSRFSTSNHVPPHINLKKDKIIFGCLKKNQWFIWFSSCNMMPDNALNYFNPLKLKYFVLLYLP